MVKFKVVYVIIAIFTISRIHAETPNKRLCADKKCSVPISLAQTLLNYHSPHEKILSFAINVAVTIYSKSTGENGLWGAVIDGKRGYIPQNMVREMKILNPANVTVDAEVPDKLSERLAPNSVQQPHEIIDGTTIYHAESNIELNSKENVPELSAFPSFESEKPQHTEDIKVNLQKPENKHHKAITAESEGVTDKESEKESKEHVQENNDHKITDAKGKESEKESKNSLVSVLNSFANWMTDVDVEAKNKSVGEDDDDEGDDEDDNVDDEAGVYDAENGEGRPVTTTNESITYKKNEEINVSEKKLKEDDSSSSSNRVDEKYQQNLINSKNKPTDKNIPETRAIFVEKKSTPYLTTENTISVDPDNALKKGEEQKLSSDGFPETINRLDMKTNEQTENTSDKVGVEESTQKNSVSRLEITPNPAKFYDELQPQDLLNALKPPIVYETVLSGQNVTDKIESLEVQNISANKVETSAFDTISKPILSESQNLVMVKDAHSNNTDATEKFNTSGQKSVDTVILEKLESLPEKEVINIGDSISNSNFEGIMVKQENDNKSEEKQHGGQNSEITETGQKNSHNQIIEGNQQGLYRNSQRESIVEIKSDKSDEDRSKYDKQADDQPEQVIKDEKQSVDSYVQVGSNDEVNSEITNSPEYVEDQSNDDEHSLEKMDNIEDVHDGSDAPVQSKSEWSSVEILNPNVNEDINPEENIHNDPLSNEVETKSEPSARDILWGSSIRKDAVDVFEESNDDVLISKQHSENSFCEAGADVSISSCRAQNKLSELETAETKNIELVSEVSLLTYDFLVVFIITASTVIIFLWGYVYIDKSRKERPLIAKINNLEKMLLVASKENQILNECLLDKEIDVQKDLVSNEVIENLKQELAEAHNSRTALEEQIQSLEKELENSTEVGFELNKMLTDVLSSQKGSDTLIANIEQLQRQLVEQQGTINSVNDTLNIRDTENHELQLELEISNKKVTDLQTELDKMVLNMLKAEEDKEQLQQNLEAEIASLKDRIEKITISSNTDKRLLTEELSQLKFKCDEAVRNLELKTNEYTLLIEGVSEINSAKNSSNSIKTIIDITAIKAELLQLTKENQLLTERLQEEKNSKYVQEKLLHVVTQDIQALKDKYEKADRDKLEAQTRLEVLSNYFKEKEAQLQKELSKQETLWVEKQGEATSTTERIKYMQGELQNYKAQNESLKQEIVSQEVDLKSQISVLEKKAHDSWVLARQAERRLEDAKQEASQLRNRLTLRERNLAEEKSQIRIQSPLEQNGELPVSPLHLGVNSPASPPLLYGTREHLTTSPPIPGLPPFLPPPPGVAFMPPSLPGVPPPFLPPPPTMFPGDHRPPPLGRMSSPPLNSRYSPDSRIYSPYDRNAPSPIYDDDDVDDYRRTPPIRRGYSPYNNRNEEGRDYNGAHPIRNNIRNKKGSAHSSESTNSNESLEKLNRHHSKV